VKIASVPERMMAHAEHTLVDWVHLVRAEDLEMPGLHLTKSQVMRLWTLEEPTCDAVLNELVTTHVLRRAARDAYVLDVRRC
jgi:hypothetical protein